MIVKVPSWCRVIDRGGDLRYNTVIEQQGADMKYTVVIRHRGEEARLECETMVEAMQVRQAFVNYGGYQEVEIEVKES